MKKLVFLFVASIVLVASSFSQSSEVIRNYIETYKDIAIQEMIRTGVPASIKLAQGIHETGAGQSVLASKSNNHFGIKCKSEWKGPSVSHDDDARGECFRKYESPFESYRDHSDFLSTRSHYASLFKLDPTDYEAWAYGLKKAGYATNPKYPQILIKIIRDYNLQEYSLIALGKKGNDGEPLWVSQDNDPAVDVASPQVEKPKKVYPSGIFKINETNVVFVPKGTAYLAIAQLYNVSLSRLFDFNELTGMEETMYDQLVFLQRKRKQGAIEFHIVEDGESLKDIAQSEGIRLESLVEYNNLKPNEQPRTGEKLHLRSKAENRPFLSAISKGKDEGSNQATFASNTYIEHVVEPKETLYSISKKYSVNVDDLMKWNNLQSSGLHIGQELRIYTKRNGFN